MRICESTAQNHGADDVVVGNEEGWQSSDNERVPESWGSYIIARVVKESETPRHHKHTSACHANLVGLLQWAHPRWRTGRHRSQAQRAALLLCLCRQDNTPTDPAIFFFFNLKKNVVPKRVRVARQFHYFRPLGF